MRADISLKRLHTCKFCVIYNLSLIIFYAPLLHLFAAAVSWTPGLTLCSPGLIRLSWSDSEELCFQVSGSSGAKDGRKVCDCLPGEFYHEPSNKCFPLYRQGMNYLLRKYNAIPTCTLYNP